MFFLYNCPLCFEMGQSLGSGALWLGQADSLGAPGVCLSPPPRGWDYTVCPAFFYMTSRDQIQVFMLAGL